MGAERGGAYVTVIDMPDADTILASLRDAARAGLPLAIAWHAVLALVLFALVALPWRPRIRVAATLASLPLLSAAAVAIASGNPFNGSILALLAVALVGIGSRLPADRLGPPPRWALAAGGASLAFGSFYPHFLPIEGFGAHLFAPPVGVLPCPTLAVVIGLALLGSGFASRTWSIVLAAGGVFYGLIGMFALGVWLDAGLLLGAVVLALMALRPARGETHGADARGSA